MVWSEVERIHTSEMDYGLGTSPTGIDNFSAFTKIHQKRGWAHSITPTVIKRMEIFLDAGTHPVVITFMWIYGSKGLVFMTME